MRRLFCLFFVLLLAIGCAPGAESAASTQVPAATAETADTPISTHTPAPTAETLATDTAEATEESAETEAETDTANLSPTDTVAEAAVVRERDWVHGAADPQVTIIEYGDFQ